MSKKPRIAILTVASATGETGGAERFYQGLHEALQLIGFEVKIVAIISDEMSFEAIEESYLRFYDLDLTEFDGIISTKAPSYVVSHPNHVCYLVHTMRVFYDMFSKEFPNPSQDLLLQRQFIQELDTAALQPDRVKKIFTIGHEVTNRLEQYNGLASEVLYPSTTLQGFKSTHYDYIFLPGRLHRWKRVDLVIEAMKQVKSEVKLKIAGTGSDEDYFKALAQGDARIEFLGRISDQQLLDLYENALLVPFLPIREDLGLVTLEAFHSQKPVLTCKDSGEPTQFIQDNVTGFICPPEPKAIAEKIDLLAQNKSLAKEMGIAAKASISSISWHNVATTLAGALGFTL